MVKNNEKTVNGEMSLPEKSLCRKVLGQMTELPYPLAKVECADGIAQMEYVIPAEDKAKVLEQLFFLTPQPGLDTEMLDIHEGKIFTVRDFKVIRWHGANIIASPYHAKSGGMLVDWMPPYAEGLHRTAMGIDVRFLANLKDM